MMWRRRATVRQPDWPDRGGYARVLLENPDYSLYPAYRKTLRRAGYEVRFCGGPDYQAGCGLRCPLLAHETCKLAAGADVLVFRLTPKSRESRRALQALKARHPSTPILVELPTSAVDRHHDLLEGCTWLPSPVTPEGLLARVREAAPETAGARLPVGPSA